MKFLKGSLVVVGALLFFASTVCADGLPRRPKPVRATLTTTYNAKNKCTVVCKGPKPFLEYIEAGLAYALDIPLAILSPITCPIVSPIMNKLDSNGGRSYHRYR